MIQEEGGTILQMEIKESCVNYSWGLIVKEYINKFHVLLKHIELNRTLPTVVSLSFFSSHRFYWIEFVLWTELHCVRQ